MTKRTKLNLIFILAALLCATAAAVIALLIRVPGKIAVVEVNGVEVARYSLSEDGEHELNGGTNVLVIEGGAVYMRFADCPDRTCVSVGRIRYAGESITCLPNRVVIYIEGDGGTDIVS